MTVPTLTVLLLADHDAVRRGLTALLGDGEDLTVVGGTASPPQAEAQAAALRPDVAVVDLPDGTGVAACRRIVSCSPGTATLLLSSFDDEEALLAGSLAGAADFVPKRLHPGDLVDAVRRAGAGRTLLDRAAAARVLEDARRRREAVRGAPFSAVQRALLRMMVAGRTDTQIAAALRLEEAAVRRQVGVLLTELGVTGPAGVSAARGSAG